MAGHTRRSILAGFGSGLSVALAGCGDGSDPAPGLHVTSAIVLHQPGDDRYDYPGDVAVRAVVENTDLDRHAGRLSVTLRAAGPDDGPTWVRDRSIELAGGTTRSYVFVFEDVGARESTYTATGTIEAP